MHEVFGPAQRLYAAIRRRAPQVAVSIVRNFDDGLTRVRVTYRHNGHLIVGWDGTTYRQWSEDGHGKRLPADPERAADHIARTLGAQVTAPETADDRS